MRVSTAFKRLLRLPGASVVDVSFGVEAVIVTVRLRRRRRVCSGCGQTGRHLEVHDRRLQIRSVGVAATSARSRRPESVDLTAGMFREL